MILEEIRSQFFAFFEDKKHTLVPSAPMVIKNDPTLMFTNAGMNQFKDYFLGHSKAKDKRVVDTQKCLRVSGKHNDLEEVGVDTYHHTMFEMLGNWSFGDYFKEQAIDWAWELLTEVYKIDKESLYVTIFEGDDKDGVPRDGESFDYWKKHINEDRILEANKDDNFWEMGEMGPCGPCSEIHVDIRSKEEKAKVDGKTLVNQDHPQVIEVWNLVFIQFNRKADGSLEKLPQTHVDTGMGLERLAMVLQGKQSNYDIDLFQSLIAHISNRANIKYGASEETDIAMRVIADHIRAIAFSITDGQLPSNTGAGYVIRRILRRAVRYGYQTLSLNESFLSGLSKVLVKEMGNAFPELKDQANLIENVIREEEISFFKTLEQGIKIFQNYINKGTTDGYIITKFDDFKKWKEKVITAKVVFSLYDTFGFPVDLTELMAKENGFTIDKKNFNRLLQEQKNRSRAATSIKTDDWVELLEDDREEFIGYDNLEADVKIVKYRKVEQKNKSFYQLVFNYTPFYPEGGGQVGDSGYIEANGDKTSIFDTKKENNLIVHLAKELPKVPEANFKAVVNDKKRTLAAANHSSTHLLHHALREVLGEHVEQKGSLVHPDYLRFDFSHFSKVTDEQIEAVERRVNEMIRANILLEEQRNVPMSKAEELGALALFGEKYGDVVRIIKFGDSVELCGGTHVENTGNIGLFKITSESAVASGVRRIEAISNQKAEAFIQDQIDILDEIKALFKNPKDIKKAVTDLMAKNDELNKKLAQIEKDKAKNIKSELKNKITEQNGVPFLEAIVPLDGGSIKDILFQFKSEMDSLIAVIGGESEGKCTLSILISEDLVKEKSLHAGNMVRGAAQHIQGGGGGQPFFATAGGKKPDGLQAAIDEVKKGL